MFLPMLPSHGNWTLPQTCHLTHRKCKQITIKGRYHKLIPIYKMFFHISCPAIGQWKKNIRPQIQVMTIFGGTFSFIGKSLSQFTAVQDLKCVGKNDCLGVRAILSSLYKLLEITVLLCQFHVVWTSAFFQTNLHFNKFSGWYGKVCRKMLIFTPKFHQR